MASTINVTPIPWSIAVNVGETGEDQAKGELAEPLVDETDLPANYGRTVSQKFSEGPSNRNSCFRFVERPWFQALSAVVIIFNTIFMFVEESDEHWVKVLFWPDQATLCFYIFELFSRLFFFSKLFFCGPRWLVAWNMLDVLVVTAGTFDQWVLPFLPASKNSSLNSVILSFRLLRLVRVVKIVRVFLETDLSWTERPSFQSFIGGVIGFNAMLMGFETDIEWYGWFYIEQVLLVIYVFELTVRVKKHGLFFLSCSNPDITWNTLDSLIVVSSAMDAWLMPMIKILAKSFAGVGADHHKAKGMKLSQVMMLMRMLRLMRILRLVKLVKSVRPLYILVTGVIAAFQGVFWVLVLTVVTLYAAGILATRLLGHGLLFPPGQPVPHGVFVFKTVGDSMFTLFRVMSGAESDEESEAIDDILTTLPSVKFAFIFFMVTSSWTLLSILTAVVSENMIATTDQEEVSQAITSDQEDRAEHVAELQDLFCSMSKTDDGIVHLEDITSFLKNKDNAVKTAKRCRVAARNVLDVLKSLASDGEPVKMEAFIECMVDVGNPVTEQSVLKIESLFKKSNRRFDKCYSRLSEQLDAPIGADGESFSKPQEEQPQDGALGTIVEEEEVDCLPTTGLQDLMDQQTLSGEGMDKLRGSIHSLLKSQEALQQTNTCTSGQILTMEARISSLDHKTSTSFETLMASLDALHIGIRSVSGDERRPDELFQGH